MPRRRASALALGTEMVVMLTQPGVDEGVGEIDDRLAMTYTAATARTIPIRPGCPCCSRR